MENKEFYTVEDIIEATGISRHLITQNIKKGVIKPFNMAYRYKDGRKYKFSPEEFERICNMYKKTGLTLSETARELGVSVSKVRELINTGVLKAEERMYGERKRIFVSEESARKCKEEQNIEPREVIYHKETGHFLFQPLTLNGAMARIVGLNKDGSGEVMTEAGNVISLEEAINKGYKPALEIEDRPYISTKGWVSFAFPKPKYVNGATYGIIEILYRFVGPRNMHIRVNDEQIYVKVRPVLLEGISLDTHTDEIQLMKSCLKSSMPFSPSRARTGSIPILRN